MLAANNQLRVTTERHVRSNDPNARTAISIIEHATRNCELKVMAAT